MSCLFRLVGTVLIALGFMVSGPEARAVGIQALKIPGDGSVPVLEGAIWYPCDTAPTASRLGPFTILATIDCPVLGSGLPLVVISHGRMGSYLSHRDTAQALAEAGFVVAAISHPGDNAQDSSHSEDLSVFVQRPTDIRRLIDYVLDGWPYSSAVDPRRIGIFGFSRGGYTGLVAVGAKPQFGAAIATCSGQATRICDQIRQGKFERPVQDDRIKAAVIADPLSVFFTDTSFDRVRVPIQLWRSERGGDGVTPDSVARVAEGLSPKPALRTVPNSQHFSFLPPCPDELARSAPEVCADPLGFDRKSFHDKFNNLVVDFFSHALR